VIVIWKICLLYKYSKRR